MRLAAIAACLVLCGCTRHIVAPGHLNYAIGSECHPTATLLNCDKSSPPKCQTAVVKFDKACERLELK